MSRSETPSSTSAKVLYRPIGLLSSVFAGLVAGQVFQQVWKRATPGERTDPPKPLETEWAVREIIVAAAVQGAIYGVVKALVSRGGARVFQRWTGEWPGS